VLAGSALLSYAYAKSEIMSAAGVFYALVVYYATREFIEVLPYHAGSGFSRTIAIVAVLFVTSAWGWRAIGLQYRLQRGAFEARSEWVLRMPPYSSPPVPAADMRVTPRLQDEALHRGRTNPYLLWPWYARLWGEN